MEHRSKSDFRAYFASVSMYLKMNYFLKQARIDSSAFSKFMKGSMFDYQISWDKLDELEKLIHQKIT